MTLEEKLKRLAERAGEEKADAKERRDEWISAVNSLYDKVENWLKPFSDKKYLTVIRTPMQKTEELLGDYEIDTLEIRAGDETVVMEPFGRNVIGALGRIDVFLRGFKSDAQMLLRLTNLEGELRWELWEHKFPGSPRYPFNEDSLEKLLNKWFD
jgi:hypothetical protein